MRTAPPLFGGALTAERASPLAYRRLMHAAVRRDEFFAPVWRTVAGGAALLLCAACTHAADPAADRVAAVAAPPPRIYVARQTVVRPEVRLPGLIAPYRNVTISNASNEPVTDVAVDEGAAVRRGEVLARLDTTDLQAQLAGAERSAAEADLKTSQTAYQGRLAIATGVVGMRSAQDSLAQAALKLRLDRRTFERNRSLLTSGFVSQAQYDDSQTTVANDLAALRSANANLSQARETVAVNGDDANGLQTATIRAASASAQAAHTQIAQIAAQIAKATIRSPIDGVVIARNVNPGEYPGSRALFTIQDMRSVYALLSATGSQAMLVHPGDSAAVVAGRGDSSASNGVVEAVLPQASPGSTTFTIKVRVPNASASLASGMVVTGIVMLAPVRGVGIPSSAFLDDRRTRVAVERHGTTHTIAVREVSSRAGQSVVSGLGAGERVVSNGGGE